MINCEIIFLQNFEVLHTYTVKARKLSFKTPSKYILNKYFLLLKLYDLFQSYGIIKLQNNPVN